MKYSTIVFDMDGTLSDTSPGVFAGVRRTLAILGRPQLSEERLRTFIGPPTADSFQRECGMTREQAVEATLLFRDYYSVTGVYDSKLYEGMQELLKLLKSAGAKVTVATLKPEDEAENLLRKENALEYFDAVSGSGPLGVSRKEDTIINGLTRAGVYSLDGVLMVGDSEYDAIGAEKVGVDFCAARYGFGLTDRIVARHPCVMEIWSPLELWEKLQ